MLESGSLSLWARYFAQRGDPGAVSFAPKYWAGHAMGDWYPANLHVDFLSYR
jgi:hypothetical protein